MFPKKRIVRGILYLVLGLMIGLVGYVLFTQWLQREYVVAAQQIKQAILQECNLTVAVEPNDISLYDIAYWSTAENRPSDADTEKIRITCFLNNKSKWQCKCEDY